MIKNTVILILILFSGICFLSYHKKEKRMDKIKIGYEYYESATKLDPANIITIYQANLIENLYSRILEFDNEMNLVCVLCEKFEVADKKLVITFIKNVVTKDGIQVTANDAKKTFYRLIKKNTNTHGNLKNLIDFDREDPISVVGNVLTIQLKETHHSQFLLPLLASIDFSILPNLSSENYGIDDVLDMRNTSGPYYVNRDNDSGNLILEANLNHPLYSKLMPQQIEIVPVEYGQGVDDFLNDKIDMLDITYYPGYPQYEKLYSQINKKFTAHKTYAINMFVLFFSAKAIGNYSQQQLFYVAKIISETYLSFKKYGYGFKKVSEYFQSNGMGHLNEKEIEELNFLRNSSSNVKFDKPIVLGVIKGSYEKMKNALHEYPEIKVVPYDEDPCFLPYDKRPDIVVQTIDSSFNEDISLLNYNFSIGNFGVSKKDGDRWIANFIKHENKKERIEILKKLQLDFLKSSLVYPIGASPYWAIANDDIDLKLSEYTPGSTWWKIRKK